MRKALVKSLKYLLENDGLLLLQSRAGCPCVAKNSEQALGTDVAVDLCNSFISKMSKSPPVLGTLALRDKINRHQPLATTEKECHG